MRPVSPDAFFIYHRFRFKTTRPNKNGKHRPFFLCFILENKIKDLFLFHIEIKNIAYHN